jgi:hypothetical protein
MLLVKGEEEAPSPPAAGAPSDDDGVLRPAVAGGPYAFAVGAP